PAAGVSTPSGSTHPQAACLATRTSSTATTSGYGLWPKRAEPPSAWLAGRPDQLHHGVPGRLRHSLPGTGVRRRRRPGRGDEAELPQDRDAVVEADFLGDKAILDLEDGGAGKAHRLAGGGWQRADRHVVERVAGMCAAAFPLADDVVALGDEIGGTPEVEVGEGRAELLGEGADLLASPAGCVQRVLEPDVRCGDLVDDSRVEVLAPEFGEPAPDDGLVLLDRHGSVPSWYRWPAAPFRSAHTPKTG